MGETLLDLPAQSDSSLAPSKTNLLVSLSIQNNCCSRPTSRSIPKSLYCFGFPASLSFERWSRPICRFASCFALLAAAFVASFAAFCSGVGLGLAASAALLALCL